MLIVGGTLVVLSDPSGRGTIGSGGGSMGFVVVCFEALLPIVLQARSRASLVPSLERLLWALRGLRVFLGSLVALFELPTRGI